MKYVQVPPMPGSIRIEANCLYKLAGRLIRNVFFEGEKKKKKRQFNENSSQKLYQNWVIDTNGKP